MINNLLLNAISWARQAGAIQLELFRSDNLDIHAKLNQSDIVTKADKMSEAFLLDRIHTHYPDHSILSEESGEEKHDGATYRWIIDPLDGTTNYSAGLPSFSVSIAIEKDGEILVGVVFAPYLGELFHAVKGGGSFLNGRPIHAGCKIDPAQAVISTGFPVDKDINPDNNLDRVSRILPQIRGLRRLGSAAVDLCYVAAGYLDAYWEINLHLWDVAAGKLIVEEAGGTVTRFRPDRNYCMAASGKGLHRWLLENLR